MCFLPRGAVPNSKWTDFFDTGGVLLFLLFALLLVDNCLLETAVYKQSADITPREPLARTFLQ